MQYYDSRNILVPSELSEGGRRLYSEDDLKRMRIICFLPEAGLPLSKIGELFAEEHPDGYNANFWDNSIAQNLAFSVVCWWLFGMLVVALIVLFSTVSITNTGVLLGIGVVVLSSYLVGLLPKCSKYLPTVLADGSSLIYGIKKENAYTAAIIIAVVSIVLCLIVSVPIFNKRQL